MGRNGVTLDHSNRFVFRIAFEGRENYRVIDANNIILPAEIAGKIRNNGTHWPAIGDWVRGSLQAGGWVLIEEVLARKTSLTRSDPGVSGREQVLAANVDTLLVVTSANQDLSLNRLDRYLALALSGGVEPVILVNKIELVEEAEALLASVEARFPGIPVHGVSAREGRNLDCLRLYATAGRTLAFVGSSGVGKSSLTNSLLGKAEAHTQEIREADGRGRHTTTHRELHSADSGAWIIDTPGLRMVGLTSDTELGSGFKDIEELAALCKFSDCRHETEPKCAIRGALEAGTLAEERWESYLKLNRELAFVERKSSKALRSQEKQRWAKIHKANRARQKFLGR